ncbi:MAG TPA: NAD(P)/FAD-dependent oxidoreductase [Anaeromyxobacter sp.]
MDPYRVIVVGGGIGGSAAALRAAQHGLAVAWIRGDTGTARASRARYVFNVDNMIGVSGGIVQRKVLELLSAPGHAAAREAVARTHFHVGIPEIVDDVTRRLTEDFADVATLVDEKAAAARRDGDGFAVETDRGRTFRAGAIVLSTGVMDRQPSVKLTTKSGKVVDDIRWIYPWANAESLLYCILCEGHLVRDTRVAVFGASEAAAQVALLLHERYGVAVTLLGNGEALQAKPETRRLLDAYGLEFREARLVELLDGETGRKGESLRGFRLEDGSEVEARFGMVAMGLHRVYNELARQLGAELDAADGPEEVRHVLVDDATSETSVRGLFAVGDMSRHRGGTPSLKQIYTAQEYAVRAVQTIDRRVRAARRARALEGK